jgi:predicted RNase H-like HicB family nuclease
MAAAERAGERKQDLDYYRAVPYVLALESVEHADGEWVRRAEYPELPGCAAEAYSAVEAIEKLDLERERILQQLWDLGAPIPVPRPPLSSYWNRPDKERLGFARWLVQEGRVSDR